MNERALAWLHKQLRKKNIALNIASNKAVRSEKEIGDILDTICIIEHLIELVEGKEST